MVQVDNLRFGTLEQSLKKQGILAQCRRPRLSELFLILGACLAIHLVLNNNDFEQFSLGTATFSGFASLDPPFVAIGRSGVQPINCDAIVGNSQRNYNRDDAVGANNNMQNQMSHLRLVEEEPRFWISIHDKVYDGVRWGVMEYGRYYERIESRCFREVLANSSQPRVIDVGGNIGWYTLLSASMGAKVDVFEPNPKNYLRMCESICVNNWVDGHCTAIGDLSVHGSKRDGRVRIFPVGVGSEESSAFFETERQGNPGAGGIVDKSRPSSTMASMKNVAQIQVMPLDEVAEKLGWYDEPIDIMKIDVEGYEIHVVRGAKKLLQSNRIKNIFMEGDVSGLEMQKNFRELVRTFADAGYMVFKIGGWAGPDSTDVPPMDENIEVSLAAFCSGENLNQKRDKCNLWWKLANE